MPENTAPKSDRIGSDHEQGPNPAPGGQVDVDAAAPPYDGRTTGRGDADTDRQESIERQLADTPERAHGQTSAPASESSAPPEDVTDAEPDSPHGVGESHAQGGEGMIERDGKEAGRFDGPTDPKTGRPTGFSDPRDQTSVS